MVPIDPEVIQDARRLEIEVLGRPHLVLPHPGGYDRIPPAVISLRHSITCCGWMSGDSRS